jgi:hypothetical protein
MVSPRAAATAAVVVCAALACISMMHSGTDTMQVIITSSNTVIDVANDFLECRDSSLRVMKVDGFGNRHN